MPERSVRVIAVANQKGGVGKSTTAVSLGAALAELGHRVLVVDLDPQGNASTGLGIRHEARDVTVYDVLAAEAPIDGAIVQTPVPNLSAIPATIDLAGAEIELVSQFSRELRLRKALEPLKHDAYEFILLDCPPSLGLLTVNALAAAEELIVPIQCEYYALEGLGQLLRNVRLVQQNVNQQLRLTGIVMTMFDPRTRLSQQVVDEVRRYFGDRVYETVIPRTVRLSEAPGFGQPITVYDPRSRGAECYRELAKEVVAKLPDGSPLPVLDDLPKMVVPEAGSPPARAPRPLVEPDGGIGATPLSGSEPPEPPDPALESEHVEPDGEPIVDEPPTVALVEVEPAQIEPDQEEEIEDLASTAEGLPPSSEASTQPEPTGDPEVELAPSTVEPVADWLRDLEARAAVEADIGVEPTRTHETPREENGAAKERGAQVEVGRIVVMDEEGDEDPEPSEDAGQAQPEGERRGRRRFGLFRRGGDR